MTRLVGCLAILAFYAAVATPASAQTRLYDPFPEPPSTERVREFLERFPGQASRLADLLSDRELEQGAWVVGQAGAAGPGSLRPTAAGAATQRARASESFGPSSLWPLVLIVLLLAVVPVYRLARRGS